MNTAQLLKERRDEYAAKKAELDALEEKIAKRTWNEKDDKPAMDAIATALRSLSGEIDALTTKLELEARQAGWTSSSTSPTAAPITVNVVKNIGDSEEKVRSRFHFAEAIQVLSGN